ncbi:hypothetical protein [Variovorax sp. YR752]|uniref:hypothetical protein n=1 Tax=Variovorax sp. YR752 TaxID=1884383 RepID=UPI003137A9A8
MNIRTLMGCAAAVLVLGACGGGGGGDALEATESVPDSASASVGGMKRWLALLTATAPEDREPLDAASFAPPGPDDTEPDPVQ